MVSHKRYRLVVVSSEVCKLQPGIHKSRSISSVTAMSSCILCSCSYLLDALWFVWHSLINSDSSRILVALRRPHLPEHLGDKPSLVVTFSQIRLTDVGLLRNSWHFLIHRHIPSTKSQF